MGLRKSFPKERQYEFWNIAMCYLIHMDQTLLEKDRTLFGTLAYRMVSKAAEIIPLDQVCPRFLNLHPWLTVDRSKSCLQEQPSPLRKKSVCLLQFSMPPAAPRRR